MLRKFNVFSNRQQLDLSGRERTVWLQPLLNLLHDHPTHFGQVLLGIQGVKDRPWTIEQVKEIETLIVGNVEALTVQAGYLSILHEAALRWCAHTRKRGSLPHFLPPERRFDNPFTSDYAKSSFVRKEWLSALSQWIDTLSMVRSDPDPRNLRVAAFLISSIVYGRVLGAPLLVALVRAIPESKRRTFIVGRVHIELSLMRKGVADCEQRIWLPDPLTATLWSSLIPTDADELVAAVMRDGKSFPPSDAVIFRRIGNLINESRDQSGSKGLSGIEELLRSTHECAFGAGSPVLVAYDRTTLSSESLRRGDVPRLFPGEQLMQFEFPANPKAQPVVADAGHQSSPRMEPDWIDLLISKTISESLRDTLRALALDSSMPKALRLVADFGVALDSRTPRDGGRMAARKIVDKIIMIGRSLGLTLEIQNLATLDPVARRTVYLDAINRQPVRTRHDAVQAIIDFDMYLVAKSDAALPVHRNKLPWLVKDNSVDANVMTHAEYFWILDRIEAAWPARRGERERKLVRLLIMLAFRFGLRRSEMSGRRIEDLLILGDAELQIRDRIEDPLKTRNAERRLPVGVPKRNKPQELTKVQNLEALEKPNELQELSDWLQRRIHEGAQAADYLFSAPNGKRISNSLFDELNRFLRNEMRCANDGEGVHLHHLRHAAGSWLFVSLLFGGSDNVASLFPRLHETHLWLDKSLSLRQQFYGNTAPSRKDPFTVARFCGHGSFDTTAWSYINIFPWLVAHELDSIESMQPDRALVRAASGLLPTKFRTWFREGGLHCIAVKLLMEQGARATIPIHSQPEPRPQAEEDWRISAWSRLVRRGNGELEPDPSVRDLAMFARADWLRICRDSQGHVRNPLESMRDKFHPETKIYIAAPLFSGRAKSGAEDKLLDQIQLISVEHNKLLSDAVGIFAEHHVRNGFLQFDSISQLQTADRYIEFLRGQGFEKRELELVSGDADIDSPYRRQWRLELFETYLVIRPCSSGRNYGPKAALRIRPKIKALAQRHSNPAAFRFTMAMAFIVFGSTLNASIA